MNEPAISVSNLNKTFQLTGGHGSLRDWISTGVGRLVGRRSATVNKFNAVTDIGFTVGHGEALGIIGPNGAGKSTVLRLLAGILRPDTGHVLIRGRLTALIEVGAGFHPELTGRENVFLNGAILGMSRAEVRAKLDDIVGFAGIDRFVDVPVKRYSSGMYARLGFSIAAHVDPDVLLVDEVLSVGDAVFRLRCLERMRELIRGGTALVFVTHNLDQMQAVCQRAVVLDGGRAVFDGPSRDAVRDYIDATAHAFAARPTDLTNADEKDEPVVHDVVVSARDASGRDTGCVRPDREIRIHIHFAARREVRKLVVELNLRSPTQERIVSFNTGRDEVPFRVETGRHTIELSVPALPLAAGHYFWNVRMWDGDSGVTLVDTPLRFPVYVEEVGWSTGSLAIPHCWTLAAEPKTSDRRTVEPSHRASPRGHADETVLLR